MPVGAKLNTYFFMRPQKEVRLIGKGKHPVRPMNIIRFSRNLTVEDYPQTNGGWKEHIRIENVTPELLQWFATKGYKVHKPWNKGYADVYIHTPQINYDAVVSTIRMAELSIVAQKIAGQSK